MADACLASLSSSNFPTVILQRSLNALSPVARKCFDVSTHADEVYSFITNTPICNFTLLKV
jgi:hypothetical protein